MNETWNLRLDCNEFSELRQSKLKILVMSGSVKFVSGARKA